MKGQSRRVVVTGLGMISPLGSDSEIMFQRLLAGDTAIKPITHFDTATCPSTVGAAVERFDFRDYIADRATLRSLRIMDPVHQWALCAAALAMRDGGLEEPDSTGDDGAPRRAGPALGVAIGTGMSGRHFVENLIRSVYGRVGADMSEETLGEAFSQAGTFLRREVNPVDFLQQCPSMAAAFIAMRYGAEGPNLTYVSLCAAGAQAIGEAAWAIARGDVDLMLAGGSDSMLNLVDLTAFYSLGAVSGANDDGAAACKPFDRRRDGCVIGEGAAFLVLEERERALSRGASIRAEVLGYGTSSDAYRVSAPPDDGEGAYQAMSRAIAHSGLPLDRITHINAHGTSTILNDRIETTAIRRLFGRHADGLTVVATKSMTGHLIAASGALEAIVAIKTLEHQMAHPTRNLEVEDPACDLDYVPGVARSIPGTSAVLSNSFAVGGVNASLIFGASPEDL